MIARDVRRRKRHVVRSHLRAAHRRIEHALDHADRARDGARLAVNDELVAFDANGNGKRAFERREILIELTEKAKVVVQSAQVDRSFGG